MFGPLGQIKKCSEPGPGSYVGKKKKEDEAPQRADWNREKKVSYMVKHIKSKEHIPGPGLNGSLKKAGWDEMKQHKKQSSSLV
jgi:hypothetical protein